MLQVTFVPAPSALSVKTCLAGLPPCPKSTFAAIFSYGSLAVMIWLPEPRVFGFPTQLSFAPTPAPGPSNVYLASGSRSNHGDHLLNWAKLFSTVKTVALGAAIAAERSTRTLRGSMYAAVIATISSTPTQSMIRLTQPMAPSTDGRQAVIQSAYLKSGTVKSGTVPRQRAERGLSPGTPPIRSCTGGRA